LMTWLSNRYHNYKDWNEMHFHGLIESELSYLSQSKWLNQLNQSQS
jgi:hypothetical protein